MQPEADFLQPHRAFRRLHPNAGGGVVGVQAVHQPGQDLQGAGGGGFGRVRIRLIRRRPGRAARQRTGILQQAAELAQGEVLDPRIAGHFVDADSDRRAARGQQVQGGAGLALFAAQGDAAALRRLHHRVRFDRLNPIGLRALLGFRAQSVAGDLGIARGRRREGRVDHQADFRVIQSQPEAHRPRRLGRAGADFEPAGVMDVVQCPAPAAQRFGIGGQRAGIERKFRPAQLRPAQFQPQMVALSRDLRGERGRDGRQPGHLVEEIMHRLLQGRRVGSRGLRVHRGGGEQEGGGKGGFEPARGEHGRVLGGGGGLEEGKMFFL